jgi:hypothetical protein
VAEQRRVGDLVDVRGTDEQEKRLKALRKRIPKQFHHLTE